MHMRRNSIVPMLTVKPLMGQAMTMLMEARPMRTILCTQMLLPPMLTLQTLPSH